jgi:hypothetical protein
LDNTSKTTEYKAVRTSADDRRRRILFRYLRTSWFPRNTKLKTPTYQYTSNKFIGRSICQAYSSDINDKGQLCQLLR